MKNKKNKNDETKANHNPKVKSHITLSILHLFLIGTLYVPKFRWIWILLIIAIVLYINYLKKVSYIFFFIFIAAWYVTTIMIIIQLLSKGDYNILHFDEIEGKDTGFILGFIILIINILPLVLILIMPRENHNQKSL